MPYTPEQQSLIKDIHTTAILSQQLPNITAFINQEVQFFTGEERFALIQDLLGLKPLLEDLNLKKQISYLMDRVVVSRAATADPSFYTCDISCAIFLMATLPKEIARTELYKLLKEYGANCAYIFVGDALFFVRIPQIQSTIEVPNVKIIRLKNVNLNYPLAQLKTDLRADQLLSTGQDILCINNNLDTNHNLLKKITLSTNHIPGDSIAYTHYSMGISSYTREGKAWEPMVENKKYKRTPLGAWNTFVCLQTHNLLTFTNFQSFHYCCDSQNPWNEREWETIQYNIEVLDKCRLLSQNWMDQIRISRTLWTKSPADILYYLHSIFSNTLTTEQHFLQAYTALYATNNQTRAAIIAYFLRILTENKLLNPSMLQIITSFFNGVRYNDRTKNLLCETATCAKLMATWSNPEIAVFLQALLNTKPDIALPFLCDTVQILRKNNSKQLLAGKISLLDLMQYKYPSPRAWSLYGLEANQLLTTENKNTILACKSREFLLAISCLAHNNTPFTQEIFDNLKIANFALKRAQCLFLLDKKKLYNAGNITSILNTTSTNFLDCLSVFKYDGQLNQELFDCLKQMANPSHQTPSAAYALITIVAQQLLTPDNKQVLFKNKSEKFLQAIPILTHCLTQSIFDNLATCQTFHAKRASALAHLARKNLLTIENQQIIFDENFDIKRLHDFILQLSYSRWETQCQLTQTNFDHIVKHAAVFAQNTMRAAWDRLPHYLLTEEVFAQIIQRCEQYPTNPREAARMVAVYINQLMGLNPVQINENQNTHTASVHATSDLTAWLLLVNNQRNLSPMEIEQAYQCLTHDIQKYIAATEEERHKQAVALRALARLATFDVIISVDADKKQQCLKIITASTLKDIPEIQALNTGLVADKNTLSELSLMEFIALLYQAIKVQAMKGAAPSLDAMHQENNIEGFINALYEIQRGYNIDNLPKNTKDNINSKDLPICFGGTVNKFCECLSGLSPLVQFIFINEKTIADKILQLVCENMRNELSLLLEQAKQNSVSRRKFCADITALMNNNDAGGIFSVYWNSSKHILLEQITSDFIIYSILKGENALKKQIQDFEKNVLAYLPSPLEGNCYMEEYKKWFATMVDAKQYFEMELKTKQTQQIQSAEPVAQKIATTPITSSQANRLSAKPASTNPLSKTIPSAQQFLAAMHFTQHLNTIRMQIILMQFNHEPQKIYAKAQALYKHLQLLETEYLATNDKTKFATNCLTVIYAAKPALEKYAGWKDIFTDLLNGLLFLGMIAKGIITHGKEFRLFKVSKIAMTDDLEHALTHNVPRP